MNIRTGLTYDDVLLVPKYSTISSRQEVSTDTYFTPNHPITTPIISANMDTVTSMGMANAMSALGGVGILHRFMTIEENVQDLKNIGRLPAGNQIRAFSIGINDDAKDRLDACVAAGGNVVCIDVAHGYHRKVMKMIQDVAARYPDLDIIAGNVATPNAAWDLYQSGAKTIKVGVGPGSLCTTRIVTGHGVPQLTAIMDIAEVFSSTRDDIRIIADGGIKSSGDIVKALAAGADTVMIGSLFAGTNETPGEVQQDTKFVSTELGGYDKPIGNKYKIYRGMASRQAQKDWKGYVSVIEGESKIVAYRGDVRNVFNQLVDGVRSGLSYSGAKNLHELRKNAEFIRITNSGLVESHPHGL